MGITGWWLTDRRGWLDRALFLPETTGYEGKTIRTKKKKKNSIEGTVSVNTGWTTVIQTLINLGVYRQGNISATSTRTVPVDSVRKSNKMV